MDTTNTSLLELSRNPLMQAMRRVIQAAAKSHLAPECLSRMSPDLAAIGRIMDLTPAQSLLFTLFVEMSYAQEINLRDLCEYVECQYIDLVAMAEELEVLLERQLIRKREGGGNPQLPGPRSGSQRRETRAGFYTHSAERTLHR